jgi:hypothetical protein
MKTVTISPYNCTKEGTVQVNKFTYVTSAGFKMD